MKYALRVWRQRPWQTGFVIAALAIGIGANVGVFSVVNALLLRSLPFHEPARLVSLEGFLEPHDSAKQFHDWRRQSAYLEDAAVFESRDANLGGAGEWRRAYVAQVSSNFFDVLGTRPVLGRTFTAGDDADAGGWGTAGRNWTVVISYGLWQELFAGDTRALGAMLRVDGNPMTVVGVAPRGFDYPENTVLWKPAAFSGGNNGWQTVARLKSGIGLAAARQAFAAEAERYWPNRTALQRQKYPFQMLPLRDELAGPAKAGSLALMACVGMILLITCTNVANLLTARTADRAGEIAIRSALGASRGRIVRQLLAECVMLAVAAAVAGMAVAVWVVGIAERLQPAALESQKYSVLDWRVLGFAALASVVCGVAFGVLPALQAGSVHMFAARGAGERRAQRLLREALVGAQVMLAIVLLAGSISVGRAFVHLMKVDRGFDPGGVVTVSLSLQGTPYETPERQLAYVEEAVARVRRLPGVRRASATEFLPLDAKGFIGGRFSLDGRRASANSLMVPALADYFGAMGARMLAGREFSDGELRQGANVAVVTTGFAREFGGPAAVLGRTLSNGNRTWQVIGVVEGMDYMAEGETSSQVFVPLRSPGGFTTTVVARVSGRAEDAVGMVREAIQSVDRFVPVFAAKTMRQRLDEALARPEFYRTAVAWFAGFALLLAAIGIYGIVSYAVTRRAHEMGVRLALGSTPARLRAKMVRELLVTIAAGAIPGVVLAAMSGRLLAGLVEGARPVDAAVYAATVALIAAIAAAGVWMASRPIAALDVMEILRSE